MSKANLAINLSKLKVFKNPKVHLEQYPTDSQIASDILWNAFMLNDIKDKVIADLGAGTGILGIGCIELGCNSVFFLEKDEDAIQILKKNLHNYFNFEIIHTDVINFEQKVDTIIMNPPFGVKNRKADKNFVETSFKNGKVIYYIGKIKSKKFIESISEDFNKKITHFWEYNMPLKKTMFFHKKKKELIKIGCWRIV